MRDKLLYELNLSLETDHDLIEGKLLGATQVLKGDGSSRFIGGVTALSMICDMLGVNQVYPVYEGGIIQKFE